jgi:lysophospholipase L1-like esterase
MPQGSQALAIKGACVFQPLSPNMRSPVERRRPSATARAGKLVLVCILAALSVGAPSSVQPAGAEPSPYPSRAEDWPGVGAIRLFDWMPEYRRAFWRQRAAKAGSIVFAGDSLTGGWATLESDFPGANVANRGIGGDVSRGLLFRFQEDVLDLQPKAVIVLIGINDLTARRPASETLANIHALVQLKQAQLPATPMLLVTVPPTDDPNAPVDARERGQLNAGLKALATSSPTLSIVDFHAATATADGTPDLRYFQPDRLHLSAAGYVRWKEILLPALRQAGAL